MSAATGHTSKQTHVCRYLYIYRLYIDERLGFVYICIQWRTQSALWRQILPPHPVFFCQAWYFCDFTGTKFFRVQVIEFFRFETTCGSHLNMDSRAFNFFFFWGGGFQGERGLWFSCASKTYCLCVFISLKDGEKETITFPVCLEAVGDDCLLQWSNVLDCRILHATTCPLEVFFFFFSPFAGS